MEKTLKDQLIEFGYAERNDDTDTSLSDSYGREISDFSISINSKGHFEVTVMVDSKRHRRFIRPNMSLYSDIINKGIYNLTLQDKIRLVEALFPPV